MRIVRICFYQAAFAATLSLVSCGQAVTQVKPASLPEFTEQGFDALFQKVFVQGHAQHVQALLKIGTMPIMSYYDGLMQRAAKLPAENRGLSFSGFDIPDTYKLLAASAPAYRDLASSFSTLGDYWQAVGFDPKAEVSETTVGATFATILAAATTPSSTPKSLALVGDDDCIDVTPITSLATTPNTAIVPTGGLNLDNFGEDGNSPEDMYTALSNMASAFIGEASPAYGYSPGSNGINPNDNTEGYMISAARNNSGNWLKKFVKGQDQIGTSDIGIQRITRPGGIEGINFSRDNKSMVMYKHPDGSYECHRNGFGLGKKSSLYFGPIQKQLPGATTPLGLPGA